MIAGVKEDVYTLTVGDVVLQRPGRMTVQEVEEVEDWLALMLRKIKREAAAQPKDDPGGVPDVQSKYAEVPHA